MFRGRENPPAFLFPTIRRAATFLGTRRKVGRVLPSESGVSGNGEISSNLKNLFFLLLLISRFPDWADCAS